MAAAFRIVFGWKSGGLVDPLVVLCDVDQNSVDHIVVATVEKRASRSVNHSAPSYDDDDRPQIH
jgi:hypothetical protein